MPQSVWSYVMYVKKGVEKRVEKRVNKGSNIMCLQLDQQHHNQCTAVMSWTNMQSDDIVVYSSNTTVIQQSWYPMSNVHLLSSTPVTEVFNIYTTQHAPSPPPARRSS